uniref:Uncharacterized protein n=1 Tax=Timema poppense TaxID=170557 RepID=A0A7R9D9R1_TIMPO|nr:unnamed protein product [Timema poppensis]
MDQCLKTEAVRKRKLTEPPTEVSCTSSDTDWTNSTTPQQVQEPVPDQTAKDEEIGVRSQSGALRVVFPKWFSALPLDKCGCLAIADHLHQGAVVANHVSESPAIEIAIETGTGTGKEEGPETGGEDRQTVITAASHDHALGLAAVNEAEARLTRASTGWNARQSQSPRPGKKPHKKRRWKPSWGSLPSTPPKARRLGSGTLMLSQGAATRAIRTPHKTTEEAGVTLGEEAGVAVVVVVVEEEEEVVEVGVEEEEAAAEDEDEATGMTTDARVAGAAEMAGTMMGTARETMVETGAIAETKVTTFQGAGSVICKLCSLNAGTFQPRFSTCFGAIIRTVNDSYYESRTFAGMCQHSRNYEQGN